MSTEYIFHYRGRPYNFTAEVKSGNVPAPVPLPRGMRPNPLSQLQRSKLDPKAREKYDDAVREHDTYDAIEKLRADIQRSRKNKKSAPKDDKPEPPPLTASSSGKSKDKTVRGVYRADGTNHTEKELEIGRSSLMALVKTTNAFARQANEVLLKAQKEGNVELEKRAKDALTQLNRNHGLEISEKYEKDPKQLSAKDVQTLVALMEEADDVIDSVQEFQISTEHLNSVIQKFDLGDKLQMAERKKFMSLLQATEKSIGSSLSGLAKNSPKTLTKDTGGASTVLATMLGAALGPFGDVAAMLVNSDWVSDKIEGYGGKAVDAVKGKVSAAWGNRKGLGKKGAAIDPATGVEVDPSVAGTPEAAPTVGANPSDSEAETPAVSGTMLTSVTTPGALHVKPMGVPAPFLDAATLEKLAKEIGDEVERGMRTLYKQLGSKAFDSDDMRLYLDTMQKELPKEMERLAKQFPDYGAFLQGLGASMQEALAGESRDVLGRLDTLIATSKDGLGEAERELELNRKDKADQKRHDELIDVLKEEGKLDRKMLKKELDDVERKAGGAGSGVLGTLAAGAAGAGVLGWLGKKLPFLKKIPIIGKRFAAPVAAEGAEAAAKTGTQVAAKTGGRFFNSGVGKFLLKTKWGRRAAGLAAAGTALGVMSGGASASEATTTAGEASPVVASDPRAGREDREGEGATAAAGGGLLAAGLLKGGMKKIPVLGGLIDGALTYNETGSAAQAIGAGLGGTLGGLVGVAAGGGVASVPLGVAGGMAGSYAGQELGKQFEKDPKKFMQAAFDYGTPMGLALTGLRALTKTVKGATETAEDASKVVKKTSESVDENSKSVETTSKDLEKTAKATEGWLARISRWNPFSRKAEPEPAKVDDTNRTTAQEAEQKSDSYETKAEHYRMLAAQTNDPAAKKQYEDAATAQDAAAAAQASAARAKAATAPKNELEAAKLERYNKIKKYLEEGGTDPQGYAKQLDAAVQTSSKARDGQQFGTGNTQDLVWNDGSGSAVIPKGRSFRGDPVQGKMGVGADSASFNTKGLSKEQATNMQMVYKAAIANGLSEDGARAVVGEIGRENAYQSKYVFGSHTDDANGQTNIGMISWQKDRADKLRKRLTEKGLMDAQGKMVQSQAAVDEQMKFFLEEGTSGSQGKKAKAATQALYSRGDSAQMADALGRYHIKYAIDTSKYGPDGMRRSRDWMSRVRQGAAPSVAGTADPASAAPLETTSSVASAEASASKSNPSWVSPMAYEAKASSGVRLGLPEVLRPSLDQNTLGAGAQTATAPNNSIKRTQPTIEDATFMSDDMGLMLVASSMV